VKIVQKHAENICALSKMVKRGSAGRNYSSCSRGVWPCAVVDEQSVS
jgi:hypothetical protein